MFAISVAASSEKFTPVDLSMFIATSRILLGSTSLSLLKLPIETFSKRPSNMPETAPPITAWSSLPPRAFISRIVEFAAERPSIPPPTASATFPAAFIPAPVFASAPPARLPAAADAAESSADIPVPYKKSKTSRSPSFQSCSSITAPRAVSLS